MVRYLMQMHFVYSGTTPKHTYMDVWKLDMKMVEKKEKKRRSQALSVQNPVWIPGSIPAPPGPAGTIAGTVPGLVPDHPNAP